MQKVQESVNASNFLLVGNQTGNRTNKTDENTFDFAGILTEASSGNVHQKEDEVSQTDKKTSQPGHEPIKPKDTVKKEDAVKEETPIRDETVEQDTAEDMKTDLSEEEKEVLLETMGTVLEMIMQQFGLSEEELTEQLKAFGMETADLFTAEGLKEFFLKLNMADVSDLLVNEDMNQELQSFLDEFKALLQENALTEEQLTTAVGESDVKEVLNEISELQDFASKMEEHLDSDDPTKEVLMNQDEPEVTVTGKEGQDTPSEQTDSEGKKENIFSKEAAVKTEAKTTVKQDSFQNPILQAVQDAVNQVGETLMAEQPLQGRDVIEQIVEQIRVTMNQETTSMELQLYPEHLGKIQINVVSKDGIMTARIVAETEAAKQAIENGLTNLKESMQQQNLKVDAIEVMVSTTGFERGNEEQGSFEEKNASKGSHRQVDLSELNEEETESDAEVERMKMSGSSVSYTA